MVKPLLIFPCNGNAMEACDCLGEGHELVGFIDDDSAMQGKTVHGWPILNRGALHTWGTAECLALPGSPDTYRSRKALIESLAVDPRRFATVVHRSASVSRFARLGRNVVVMAGAVICADAVIEDHVCILPNSVVHHDVVIGAWTLVGSQVTVAGGSTLEENCYIGSGASIRNGLRIGARALVGLGATVVRDVAPDARMVGNPAREL